MYLHLKDYVSVLCLRTNLTQNKKKILKILRKLDIACLLEPNTIVVA